MMRLWEVLVIDEVKLQKKTLKTIFFVFWFLFKEIMEYPLQLDVSIPL